MEVLQRSFLRLQLDHIFVHWDIYHTNSPSAILASLGVAPSLSVGSVCPPPCIVTTNISGSPARRGIPWEPSP
jgi:hypothetical protein